MRLTGWLPPSPFDRVAAPPPGVWSTILVERSADSVGYGLTEASAAELTESAMAPVPATTRAAAARTTDVGRALAGERGTRRLGWVWGDRWEVGVRSVGSCVARATAVARRFGAGRDGTARLLNRSGGPFEGNGGPRGPKCRAVRCARACCGGSGAQQARHPRRGLARRTQWCQPAPGGASPSPGGASPSPGGASPSPGGASPSPSGASRRPVAPARRPVAPARRPVAPARRPVAPARRPVAPARRPVAPGRHRVVPDGSSRRLTCPGWHRSAGWGPRLAPLGGVGPPAGTARRGGAPGWHHSATVCGGRRGWAARPAFSGAAVHPH